MGPHELLKRVVETLEGLRIPYFVTGSLASMAYGEPRLTNDIDIVIWISNLHIPRLMASFPSEEFYISESMIREAILRKSQFNIIHPASGLKVDMIIRKDTDFEQSCFERIRRISPAEGYQANFSSPEDIIIQKMDFYREGGSEKHLRDITGILKVSGNEVNRNYIIKWATKLGLTEIWEAILKRLSSKDLNH